jgi:hypothetical protein
VREREGAARRETPPPLMHELHSCTRPCKQKKQISRANHNRERKPCCAHGGQTSSTKSLNTRDTGGVWGRSFFILRGEGISTPPFLFPPTLQRQHPMRAVAQKGGPSEAPPPLFLDAADVLRRHNCHAPSLRPSFPHFTPSHRDSFQPNRNI